jgi:hypothetical protein
VLAQPWHLPVPTVPRPVAWWEYTGPLAVVFPGGPDNTDGELVLPVRLPQGTGRWPYLLHYLDRPENWHKIDLVRRLDPSAPGGWTYEAHLLILDVGYDSPATHARRATAAGLERIGGVDGNVSNLSVVSFPVSLDPADGQTLASQIVPTEAERAKLERERRKAKGRERALERSRRNDNREQYRLSKRQQRRAERRKAAGLAARTVEVPRGPRVANAVGIPKQAYRKDRLSNGYRRLRATHARAAASEAEAKTQRARTAAAQLVAVHGARLTVEDTSIRTWFKLWGRACSAFTPGKLVAALDRECRSVAGGRLIRASTARTAWSQHCLCGARVAKSLRDRVHVCPECGLIGDRDKVASALGAFTVLEDPSDPSTARVDYASARHAMGVFGRGLQEALSESTATPPLRAFGSGRRGSPPARWASARRSAGECDVPTPDETQPAAWWAGTTPERHARNPDCPSSWDSS